MSTKAVGAKESPTTWYVVLHLVDGRVEPQLEWWREMKVHDKVKFLSPDGTVEVKFTPEDAKDQDGNPVTGLYPFGTEHIKIKGDTEKPFEVIHSCKSLMTCSIIKNGVRIGWKGAMAASEAPEWDEGEYAKGGTHVCTRGGDKPVVCG
jgi:hypothetical protein